MRIAYNELLGDRVATFDEVCAVALPEKTKTYEPVPNKMFVELIKNKVEDKLPGWDLVEENYILAREGQRMFATIMFKHASYASQLCWAIGNSYDKSMSARFASGSGVECCSNTHMGGDDMVFLRKHTKHVVRDLDSRLDDASDTAVARLLNRIKDMTAMKEREITMERGFEVLGLLRGKNILGATEFSKALEHWVKPPFEEFEPRNVWSLYNSGTWALHIAPPHRSFEKRRDLDAVVLDLFPKQDNDVDCDSELELA
tara:strand:+ start:1830 stop:2603 length:774 start_codon:yes stop_codon:yes gene_type:complete